jgi:hypothetical protein
MKLNFIDIPQEYLSIIEGALDTFKNDEAYSYMMDDIMGSEGEIDVYISTNNHSFAYHGNNDKIMVCIDITTFVMSGDPIEVQNAVVHEFVHVHQYLTKRMVRILKDGEYYIAIQAIDSDQYLVYAERDIEFIQETVLTYSEYLLYEVEAIHISKSIFDDSLFSHNYDWSQVVEGELDIGEYANQDMYDEYGWGDSYGMNFLDGKPYEMFSLQMIMFHN